MRPHQWYKNLLIFVGIVFSVNLTNFSMYPDVILAFVIFCTISGCVHIFNDIEDREKDIKHPEKRKRPIASGALPVFNAAVSAIILLILAIFASFYFIGTSFFLVALSYFALSSLYTYWLKNIVIADIVVISIGFVLRAVAGAVAIDVVISPWLVVVTMLGALFLATGKRRHEIITIGENVEKHKKVLGEYSVQMLENMLGIAAACSIMAYSLFTFMAHSQWMMITIPLVIFGIFKYLQLIHTENIGGEPEMIFKNKAIMVNLVLWVVLVILVMYGVLDQLLDLFMGL